MTEVSVIVPVYNVRTFLPACVASVRGQTMKDLELILVDDGSTDGSGELCDALAKEDARIRVLHTENGGQGRARNLGLDVARGEYISFVDADDAATPEMLAAALPQARQENADMVVFGIKERYVDSQGQVVQERGELLPKLSGSVDRAEFWQRFPDTLVSTFCVTRLYRRAFLQEHGICFSPTRMGEDAYFLNSFYDAPFTRIAYLQRALYLYGLRPNSTMTSFNRVYFDAAHEATRSRFYEIVRRNAPTPGAFEKYLTRHCVQTAHEALKQLSFARGQVPQRERLALLRQFCAYPRVAEGVAACTRELAGSQSRWLTAVLLKKRRYRLALAYYDGQQTVRKLRNRRMKWQ